MSLRCGWNFEFSPTLRKSLALNKFNNLLGSLDCRQEAEGVRREASEASQEAGRLRVALREVRGVLALRKADGSMQSSHSTVAQALP